MVRVRQPSRLTHDNSPTHSSNLSSSGEEKINASSKTAEEEILPKLEPSQFIRYHRVSSNAPHGKQVRIRVHSAAVTPLDLLRALERFPHSFFCPSSAVNPKKANMNPGEDQEDILHGTFATPKKGFFQRLFRPETPPSDPQSVLHDLGLSGPLASSPPLSFPGDTTPKHRGYWGGTTGVGVVEAVGSLAGEGDEPLQVGDRVQFYTSAPFISRLSGDLLVDTKLNRALAIDGDSLQQVHVDPSIVLQSGGSWAEYAMVDCDTVVPLVNAAGELLGTQVQSENGLPSNQDVSLRSLSGFSDDELAVLPFVGWTAYIALFDKLRIKPGESILVVGGGSDGVGFVAAQLARYVGLEVFVTGGREAQKEHSRDQYIAACLRRRGVRVLLEDGEATNFTTEVDRRSSCLSGEANEFPSVPLEFDHILLCSTDSFSIDILEGSSPSRRSTREQLNEIIKKRVRHGGNICSTVIPPPQALLELFQIENEGLLLRERNLSLHFVLLHGLFQYQLTKPLLRSVGKKVWELYCRGAFQLYCQEVDTSSQQNVDRVAPGSMEVKNHNGDSMVLKVFSSQNMWGALEEAARQLALYPTLSFSSSSPLNPRKNAKEINLLKERILNETKAMARKKELESSSPLFVVVDFLRS